ncbi:hypothetical protein EAH80_04375 [Mycobacterium hodleri]|uniref:Uncharacterized protein n=1 Tax=Mycolicibacterium hodleri TaxID=49897 RepID=A0A502ELC5_9MYCO|nr:hypothetical protein EAH80_04375 [Mycolicibacterium hodleri]
MINPRDIDRGKELAESGKYVPTSSSTMEEEEKPSPPGRELEEGEYVAGRMPTGQMRMALILADLFRDELLFVHGVGWHYWDGQRWAYDDVGATECGHLTWPHFGLCSSRILAPAGW